MKFIAKKYISDKITIGHIYYGSLIWKVEGSPNSSSITQELKIVVYNDKGTWSAYSPSAFKPDESTD